MNSSHFCKDLEKFNDECSISLRQTNAHKSSSQTIKQLTWRICPNNEIKVWCNKNNELTKTKHSVRARVSHQTCCKGTGISPKLPQDPRYFPKHAARPQVSPQTGLKGLTSFPNMLQGPRCLPKQASRVWLAPQTCCKGPVPPKTCCKGQGISPGMLQGTWYLTKHAARAAKFPQTCCKGPGIPPFQICQIDLS